MSMRNGTTTGDTDGRIITTFLPLRSRSLPSAAAYRTRLLAGVSNGTWILSFVEGVLWLMYGWMIRDAALAAGGAAGVVMSGVILARLELTGHEPFVVPFPRRAAYAR